MGCFISKKKKQVQATYQQIWDLLDSNGDSKVSPEELDAISKIVHNYKVEQCKTACELLRHTDATLYTLSLVGKSKGDDLMKKHLKILAAALPFEIWHNRVLPLLREKEITRLTIAQEEHQNGQNKK